MGFKYFKSSCSGNCTTNCAPNIIIKDKNPDPSNFEILQGGMNKNFTIVRVRYPDCDNFEGEKILVYKGPVLKEIMKQKKLDPHFCDKCPLSPIARFAPTEEGLSLALKLTATINQEK
jgi:hypothetical protein